MAAVFNIGRDSGLWDTTLRTDIELITKKELGRNAKNLDYFDALVFVSTTGELDLDDSSEERHDVVHQRRWKRLCGRSRRARYHFNWPEYGEMIGGWFDQHPWSTFNAPIINEDPTFPAVRHFPAAFLKYDEIYQPKQWSRETINVLLSLDPTNSTFRTTLVSTARP